MSVPAGPKESVRLLLVEDDENDALLVIRKLERDGLAPVFERVFSASDMKKALERSEFDVVLSDFSMPSFDALQALRILRESGRDTPFIVVSGTIGEETAVRAMKAGAQDYFAKTNLGRLASAIAREMREASGRRERREALASRRSLEERLRLVIESVKEYAIYVLDPEGRVATWHAGAERIYGYSETEMLGRHVTELFQTDDAADGTADRILARARAGESFQGELFQACAGGALFWADVTVAPLRDDLGRLRGFSVVARDITDRAKLLEELRVAVRSRDEFLSMASHELRTPVTALQLQLQAIRRTLDRSGEDRGVAFVRERMQTLERQTGRIALLVGELLDLSRMRLGRLRLTLEEVNLADIVQETLDRLRHHAERAGCELSLAWSGAPLVGRWDRLRIEQVITNLVMNAVKFGSGKPVAVAVDEDGDRVRISVEDQGIGIAPEDQARVFERFERAASAENYGGLGLGLFITRQIVEAHGGTIAVRSAPGGGATFTVELPRLTDAQMAALGPAGRDAPEADGAAGPH